VLQPRREREKGFQSGSGCLPTPLPLSPPPTLLAAAAGCTLKQRAFLPLFLPPHTAHTISSPRLDFLAAYLSQSPHLLLDCNPHSPEPPPCRGSTARGSPLRETSPLRLEAIQMLIGRAAHGFLLFFIRQLLMPRLLLCPLFLFGLIGDIVMALTIIIGSFGFLQSVLSRVARRAPEAGAFHAGVAYMQQVVESR